jgi:1,4-alpha-glucan branching enzyme
VTAFITPHAKHSSSSEQSHVEAIIRGTHGDPFAVLGLHGGSGRPLTLSVFAPEAQEVEALSTSGERIAQLVRIHEAGFFAKPIPGERKFPART